jgi:salicylate hydroxylase
MSAPRIAIVGAGIGGLTAALAFARQGIVADVYEQAPQLGEVGAGLSLSPNAVKGIWFLGLEDELAQLADEPPVQVTRHYKTGEILIQIDRSDTTERYGAPYLQLHRADLHGLLARALEDAAPGRLHTGRELVALDERDDRVLLSFADGSSASAELVIGADGIKSRIRTSHFAEDAAEFTGYVAWRGLVPGERLAHMQFPPGGSVLAGPGRLFVRYPIRHGALMNYVAFARTRNWEPESWSQTGAVDEVLAALADFHDEVREVVQQTPGQRCHKWGLFAREPVPKWSTARVALLGDAAHPMLPWFGQGAATAIEDGVILARAFADSDSTAEALRRYEAARQQRLDLIYTESMLGGERLAGAEPKKLSAEAPRFEDTLGITTYDPATAAV